MWSNNNVYAKQNGGTYDFIVEPSSSVEQSRPDSVLPEDGVVGPAVLQDLERTLLGSSVPGQSGLAIPNDQALWDDLMSNKVIAPRPNLNPQTNTLKHR